MVAVSKSVQTRCVSVCLFVCRMVSTADMSCGRCFQECANKVCVCMFVCLSHGIDSGHVVWSLSPRVCVRTTYEVLHNR